MGRKRSATDLYVSQALRSKRFGQRIGQPARVPGVVNQWLAVIRERKGDQAPPGDPALYAAERHAILQRYTGGRGRIDHWFEAVGTAKRLDPRDGVKNGGARMPVHELSPSRVLERLNPIDGPWGCLGAHASVRFWD
jgi:hypothetical protein